MKPDLTPKERGAREGGAAAAAHCNREKGDRQRQRERVCYAGDIA